MWGGSGISVRSDVTSGHNRRWEWRPDAGDAKDGKTMLDLSGRGACASHAGLMFADVALLGSYLVDATDHELSPSHKRVGGY